jgi:L-seryl-tRNA(Ser) seleniumtransferase
MHDAHAALRQLPSVDRLVETLRAQGQLAGVPRQAVTLCAREVLEVARARVRTGDEAAVSMDRLVAEVLARLERFGGSLRPAVNATGVVLHTNLGRAPLSRAARAAVLQALDGYTSLEIDLASGGRGTRHAHVEDLLRATTGAEAGFAVNNNAAAVTLALAALSAGRDAVVSRGELVEIGGSFRMPAVMAQSGARLVEVGTTNRTYRADYAAALGPTTGVLLKVHRSNFSMRGFVHEATLDDLVALGRDHGVPVVYDLGSGCLVDLGTVGLPQEPMVQTAVAAGADVVLFSGDKLLGGPQAGIMVGRAEAIDRCRRHPLARAVRLDKLSLAALAATLRAYLDPARAWREIPVLAMLATSPARRRRRATRLARALAAVCGDAARVTVVSTHGEVGGGALPDVPIPSYAVALQPARGAVDDWARRLRQAPRPVIGVVREGALLLDVLALLPGEERIVRDAVARLVAPGQAGG